MNTLLIWAQANPLPTGAAATLLLAVLVTLLRTSRTPAAVLVASLAAMACTAYSGDTSWRFAEHRLGMTSAAERGAMFAAAELALFSCALMARQNLRGPQGAPGTPGILVWFITGVQVIPAYSESGIVGGTVRAVVGPVMAAMLWHLAMGIELRHAKPGAGSQSLPAIIARELRERLLSRLGLATRDRTAEQITRDRATARAVQLAARPKLRRWGKSRLAAAVARSGVGVDPEQRAVMVKLLAARRGAEGLATVSLRSPFEPEAASVTVGVDRVPDVPAAHPALETAVPAVPEAVPAGVRLLPTFDCPGELSRALRNEIRNEIPAPVLAADETRTRPEVHAEYVPEPAPGGIAQAELDEAAMVFKDELLAGKIPGIARIKSECRVGQDKAKEIQDGFREAQVAWRLAGTGVRS